MIQKPLMYSFDSMNGPSVHTGDPPLPSMTVARAGDVKPPANTQ